MKTEEQSGVHTMRFSTTGEYLQGIMMDLFSSGEFKTFEQFVLDSGMDDRHQNLCFRHQFELTGDTRDGGDLNLEVLAEMPLDFGETLFTAIRTSIGSSSDCWNDRDFFDIIENCKTLQRDLYSKTLSNMVVLMKYFTPEEIYNICRKQILNHYGYSVDKNMADTLHGQRATSGVLCKSGEFIEVPFEQHRFALPVLAKLGYVTLFDQGEVRRSTDDGIHISSNTVSGGVGFQFSRANADNMSFTQISELWKNSDIVDRFYLSNSKETGTVGENAFNAWVNKYNKGGKMGGLQFLRTQMKDELFKYNIKIAQTSLNLAQSAFKDDEKVFIRTSPKKSLPGLLESKLVDNNEKSIDKALNEIHALYTEVQDLRRDNELKTFFQRFIKGGNGVAHLDYKKGIAGDYQHLSDNFRYSASNVQGDIVGGSAKGEYRLDPVNADALHNFMKILVKRIRKKIQIEFIEDENNQLYIVQVRIIEGGNNELEASNKDLSGFDVLGQTFTESWRNPTAYAVDIDDVLIVDSEASPNDLIGKKLLIVRENVDFSHILALSSALSIPSIYGLLEKDFDFSEAKRIVVNTSTQTGIIKIEK